ncbi:p23 chaperone protein wos2 [Metarhizium acridum]|nr:p23 chaperone protein wos2 [Metarhizium acridum]
MAETATPEGFASPQSAEDENNFIFLTINVPDVPKDSMQLDLKPDSLTFTGTSGTLKRKYHVELPFYAEIDPEASKIHHTAKNIEIKIQKKERNKEYWPRLLKDSKKLHFLKTDFDKWVDEDEQNEAFRRRLLAVWRYGYVTESSIVGMPGMGGDFGGIDFSKLGGAGGMPDLGAMGGEEGEEDSGDDDDEMPALEGEEGAKKE